MISLPFPLADELVGEGDPGGSRIPGGGGGQFLSGANLLLGQFSPEAA